MIETKHSGLESLRGLRNPEYTKLGRDFLNKDLKFLFDSKSWKVLLQKGMVVAELDRTFRQSDTQFIDILDEIRIGKLSEQNFLILKETKHQVFQDEILPTKLFMYKHKVATENKKSLDELTGDVYTFNALDSIDGNICNSSDSEFKNVFESKQLSLLLNQFIPVFNL